MSKLLEDDLVPDEWTEEEHHQMDEQVRSVINIPNTQAGDIRAAAHVLLMIVTDCGERLDQRFSNIRTCEAILKADASLMLMIVNGLRDGFKKVRCLRSLRPPKPEPAQKAPPSMNYVLQANAIMDAWNGEFVGDAADALWDHVHHLATTPIDVRTNDGKVRPYYTKYCSIGQSSGMGKSRAVDEMSKNHFVIPISFLAEGSSGYPPQDKPAYRYITAASDQRVSFINACTFLHALFEVLKDVLSNRHQGAWPPGLAGIDTEQPFAPQFRTLMREGMRPGRHGEFRGSLYLEVCSRATQLIPLYEKVMPRDAEMDRYMQAGESPLNVAFKELRSILEGHVPPLSSSGERAAKILKRDPHDEQPSEQYPLVVLAFDEVHTLTETKGGGSWSTFGEIQGAIRVLANQPVFALFLSTMGEFARYNTAPKRDFSGRMMGEGEVIPPFTELGFDLMARNQRFSVGMKLSEVSSEERFCCFGRPLWYEYSKGAKQLLIKFAAMKLLGGTTFDGQELEHSQKLACLAHRIPIEFLSTVYTSKVAVEERTQVQAHMRVVLKFDDTLQTMVTASPSEPILSEAAYWMMGTFDVADAMMDILHAFSVNKGDRGELMVMLLLTMARDSAVGPSDDQGRPRRGHRWCSVPALLESLFSTTTSSDDHVNVFDSFGAEVSPTQDAVELTTRLEDMFGDSKVYFNHFAKIQEQKVVHKRYLVRLMARGAAVLCTNCHPGVDMIVPFLFRGEELEEDQIGAILVQVKNDEAYTHNPRLELFGSMDPHDIGISPSAGIPVIRIVFALAATTPALVEPDSSFRTAQNEYSYRAYDFWVAGLSPTILRPIVGKENTWKALLQASYGWQAVYKARSKLQKKLRKSTNPGVASGGEHWENWCE